MAVSRDQIKRMLDGHGIDSKKLTESEFVKFEREVREGNVGRALKGLGNLRSVRESGHAGEIADNLRKIQRDLGYKGVTQKQAPVIEKR